MTLVEVMFATVIVLMLAGGLYGSVILGNHLTYAAAQRQAAFGLCTELLEEMRSVHYSFVTAATFPAEPLQLTHLGGAQRIPLFCSRSCTIAELANPLRKNVRIRVSWNYQGKAMQETLDSVIYYRKE
jgi:hypothetical protein